MCNELRPAGPAVKSPPRLNNIMVFGGACAVVTGYSWRTIPFSPEKEYMLTNQIQLAICIEIVSYK